MLSKLFNLNHKPKVRFHCLSSAVNTLYPIIPSSKLNRNWISEEQKNYKERKSKCPFGKINIASLRSSPIHSITKCPAIHSIMNQGLIVRAPADFYVHTNGDGSTILPQCMNVVPHIEYVVTHEEEVSSWLLDSSKDNTLNKILKINTPWRITTNDDDIIFLVTKVPFVNESRFTAVQAIMDPKIAFEVNIQLFWHVKEGDITVKAGTPLCQYIPISRSLLSSLSYICDDATEKDWNAEKEMIYAYDHVFAHDNTLQNKVSRFVKIIKKYYD